MTQSNQSNGNQRAIALVNPRSGKGDKNGHNIQRVKLLKKYGINEIIYEKDQYGREVSVQQLSDKYRTSNPDELVVVVNGGDGTLEDALNSIGTERLKLIRERAEQLGMDSSLESCISISDSLTTGTTTSEFSIDEFSCIPTLPIIGYVPCGTINLAASAIGTRKKDAERTIKGITVGDYTTRPMRTLIVQTKHGDFIGYVASFGVVSRFFGEYLNTNKRWMDIVKILGKGAAYVSTFGHAYKSFVENIAGASKGKVIVGEKRLDMPSYVGIAVSSFNLPVPVNGPFKFARDGELHITVGGDLSVYQMLTTMGSSFFSNNNGVSKNGRYYFGSGKKLEFELDSNPENLSDSLMMGGDMMWLYDENGLPERPIQGRITITPGPLFQFALTNERQVNRYDQLQISGTKYLEKS